MGTFREKKKAKTREGSGGRARERRSESPFARVIIHLMTGAFLLPNYLKTKCLSSLGTEEGRGGETEWRRRRRRENKNGTVRYKNLSQRTGGGGKGNRRKTIKRQEAERAKQKK